MDGDVDSLNFTHAETSWRQRSEYTREMRTHFEDKTAQRRFFGTWQIRHFSK